jgi:hypothetical protein
MSTSFEGVRQSRYITSPAKQITADLDVDLNESSETPKIEFTNLNNKNSLLSIGVLNPKDAFDFENNLSNNATSIDKFKRIGVTQFTDEVLGKLLNDTRILLQGSNIKTNSQVTMFLSSILSNSDNLLKKEMEWDVSNKETYINKFPTTDLLNKGKNKYYGNTSTPDSKGYLLSLPIFTGGSINDISYNIPGNDILKEFAINDEIENRKNEINERLPKLDVNVTTEKTEKEKLEKELSELLNTESSLIKTLTYYNIFEGDAYRFKPRGYLYVIGRKQYTDILGDVGQTNPNAASDTEVSAMGTSIKMWNYLKDNNKSAYDFSSLDSGSATVYSKCISISQQYNGKSIEESFITFEKVLTNLTQKSGEPLINYFNPGP